MNFQESTTILNAYTKKVLNLIEFTMYIYIYIHILSLFLSLSLYIYIYECIYVHFTEHFDPWERYVFNYSHSSYGLIVEQTGLFNLGMAASQGEIKPVKLC